MTLQLSQSLAIAAAVGLLSGTHTAIWGMYKDTAHEGFGVTRFARSIVVGMIAALLLQAVLALPLPSPAAIVVLFGLAYATERGLVEVWKTFVRDEDQSKYFIPMQFSVGGVPVASRRARLAAGLGYVLSLAGCLTAIGWVDPNGALEPALRAAIGGLALGVAVAIGGAWKDAPKEGFDGLKFIRSPLITVTYAVGLSLLTDSHLYAAVAAIGYERATAETYKTFFFPSKPRGKFNGKPVRHPHMLVCRRYFVPAYLAISVAALVCMLIAVGS